MNLNDPNCLPQLRSPYRELVVEDELLQDGIKKFAQVMAGQELPKPDHIECNLNELRFIWDDKKVAVVVDLTEERERRDAS